MVEEAFAVIAFLGLAIQQVGFFLVRGAVLHGPGGGDREYQQERQPERGVQQYSQHGQLHEPQQRRRRAWGQTARYSIRRCFRVCRIPAG